MKPIQTLKIGISGVRGVVGESLTPTLLIRFAESFGTYLWGGSVVIGSDTRTSREMARHAVVAGLTATGCPVVDLGICPVPTIQWMVEYLHAAGGIALTASHNPAEWNALKFIRSDGIFLNQYQAEELLDIYHQGQFRRAEHNHLGSVRLIKEGPRLHTQAILKRIDRERIRSLHLKVVVDCCNGAGSVITPEYLQELGCEVVTIYCEPDGIFPRPPEPIPENLSRLCEVVRQEKADLGFAQDADADRLAVVSEEGNPIGEEFSVALATEYVLRHTPGPVVVNLSTTSLIEEIAQNYGCPVYRTPVGEVNVAEKMKKVGAVIGGEGNGGVIWPTVHIGRDSFVGIALLLSLISEEQKPLSQIIQRYPPKVMIKEKVPCPSEKGPQVLALFRQYYQGFPMDFQDGIKVFLKDAWIHIRPSRTEPVIRLTLEADTEDRAQALKEEGLSLIFSLLKSPACEG